MRLQSAGSKSTSFPTPTLTRTRSSRSRPESWRCAWKTPWHQFTTSSLACPQEDVLSPNEAHWFISCPSQASVPFAVIGSNQLIEVKGKKIRGRLYPWGVVEVENPEHNDFLKLRTMLVWVSSPGKSQTPVSLKPLTFLKGAFAANLYCLLVPKGRNCHCRTHMQDLQEVTQDLHYENFRSERLKRACR